MKINIDNKKIYISNVNDGGNVKQRVSCGEAVKIAQNYNLYMPNQFSVLTIPKNKQ